MTKIYSAMAGVTVCSTLYWTLRDDLSSCYRQAVYNRRLHSLQRATTGVRKVKSKCSAQLSLGTCTVEYVHGTNSQHIVFHATHFQIKIVFHRRTGPRHLPKSLVRPFPLPLQTVDFVLYVCSCQCWPSFFLPFLIHSIRNPAIFLGSCSRGSRGRNEHFHVQVETFSFHVYGKQRARHRARKSPNNFTNNFPNQFSPHYGNTKQKPLCVKYHYSRRETFSRPSEGAGKGFTPGWRRERHVSRLRHHHQGNFPVPARFHGSLNAPLARDPAN